MFANLTEDCLSGGVENTPDKTALIFLSEGKEETYSYRELHRLILSAANGIRSLGEKPGSRFIFRANSSLDFFLLFFGSIRAGLVPNASFPGLKEREILECVEDAKAALYYESERCAIHPRLPSFCRQVEFETLKKFPADPFDPRTRASDPAYIVYTSGSTSKPKGVIHSHNEIRARGTIRKFWEEMGEGDRVFHTRNPHWTYTMRVNFFDTWAAGATAIARAAPPTVEETLKIIEKYRVTVFATIPLFYKEIVRSAEAAKHQLRSLRIALSAGEYLDPFVEEKWRGLFRLPIYQALGTTELGTPICESPLVEKRRGSIGQAAPGLEVEVLPLEEGTQPVAAGTTGVLAFRKGGPGMMLGYTQMDEGTQKHFRGEWFLPGDLVRRDADGYIWHCGRPGDILKIRGAIRVSAKEVEAVYRSHPGVFDAACTATKNENQENVLTLFIVPGPGAHQGLEEELKALAKKNLSPLKTPERIVFLKELPKNRNGKTDYKKLSGQ